MREKEKGRLHGAKRQTERRGEGNRERETNMAAARRERAEEGTGGPKHRFKSVRWLDVYQLNRWYKLFTSTHLYRILQFFYKK